MKRRWTLLVVVSAALALALAFTTGCCPILQSVSSEGKAGGGSKSSGGGKPSLKTFLDADSKTGEYSAHTEWFEGDSFDQTGEFWVDGRQFRYDIYEEDKHVRSVMSPDGETAYFVYYDEELCEPSVASVDYYLSIYSKPGESSTEDGKDEETGATRVVYAVKSTDDMAGSSNPWYTEDITYLVKDDEVVGVITRGAVPEDDGTIPGLDVSRMAWSNVKVGVKIPADTFELPYPIQKAE